MAWIKSRLSTLIIRELLMAVLSLALLTGGFLLLVSQTPGWSLLFSLILLPLGISLTIFTIDDVARKLFVPPQFRAVKCKVCGKATYSSEENDDAICGHCRENLTDEVLETNKKRS